MNGLPYMTKLSLPIKVKKQTLSVNDTSPHNMQNGKDGQFEQLALAGPELQPRVTEGKRALRQRATRGKGSPLLFLEMFLKTPV